MGIHDERRRRRAEYFGLVETEEETPNEEESPDLSDMTKKELLDLAEEQGVEVSPAMKKAEIVEALDGAE